MQTEVEEQADDRAANTTVRRVATRPRQSAGAFPTQLASQLYPHVDQMRTELFEGQLPEVVLSFETRNR